jgi:hypothetical protein
LNRSQVTVISFVTEYDRKLTPGTRTEIIVRGDTRYAARFSGHHVALFRWRGRRRDFLARVLNNGAGWQQIERILAVEEAAWRRKFHAAKHAD